MFFQTGGYFQPCSQRSAHRSVHPHLLKSPVPPVSLHLALLCLLCPFPVFHPPFPSASLSASLPQSPPFSVSPAPPPFSLSLIFYGAILRTLGIRRSLETAGALPSRSVPLPWGCGRKDGQRAEDGGRSSQNCNWSLALVGKERRKPGTWGQRVWVSDGAKAAPEL